MRGSLLILATFVLLIPTATASVAYDTACFVIESDVLTPPSTDVPGADTEVDKVQHVYAEVRDCDKTLDDHANTIEAYAKWLVGQLPDAGEPPELG